MDWGLVVTTVLAVVNVVVLGVGGAWAVAKIKSVSDMNTSDVAEIKRGILRIEGKMETHREITNHHGERLARLEAHTGSAGGRH